MDPHGHRIYIENVDPSNKILQPPGGASSNIFGEPDEADQKKRAVKNRMQSNIFGVSDSATAHGSSQKQAGNGETDATGKQPETDEESKDADDDEKAKQNRRGGTNPITGEPFIFDNPPHQYKQIALSGSHPTRPRQPPGGASSKLW